MIFFGKEEVKFTETILRDAHQSLMATRMKTEDMLPIAEVLDEVGYDSIECWGGATFDVCMRYLNEDPWERLRQLRKRFRKTKLQMLLRGQNLLGYNHYPDDVVDAFIRKSVDNGIDIFRIFDAFNDVRNLERAAHAAKQEGAHVQLALAYTVGRKYTFKYWKSLAKELEELGADSICIKDMAGLLMPYDADKLVKILDANFPCVDTGFGTNKPVDAVIRPEDVELVSPEDGLIRGVVTHLIFKGVHYEMEVLANNYELLVHSTDMFPVGTEVGIRVDPFDIQIMKKPESEDAEAVGIEE